jgi:hypothetical protein
MRHFHKQKNHYHCPIVNLDKLWALVGEEVRLAASGVGGKGRLVLQPWQLHSHQQRQQQTAQQEQQQQHWHASGHSASAVASRRGACLQQQSRQQQRQQATCGQGPAFMEAVADGVAAVQFGHLV